MVIVNPYGSIDYCNYCDLCSVRVVTHSVSCLMFMLYLACLVEGVPCYWLLLQLPPISLGNDPLDLVVIGCGPAGLALAAESAKLGLTVGLIGPDLPFTNNYGVWEDEFKGTSNLSKFSLSFLLKMPSS